MTYTDYGVPPSIGLYRCHSCAGLFLGDPHGNLRLTDPRRGHSTCPSPATFLGTYVREERARDDESTERWVKDGA